MNCRSYQLHGKLILIYVIFAFSWCRCESFSAENESNGDTIFFSESGDDDSLLYPLDSPHRVAKALVGVLSEASETFNTAGQSPQLQYTSQESSEYESNHNKVDCKETRQKVPTKVKQWIKQVIRQIKDESKMTAGPGRSDVSGHCRQHNAKMETEKDKSNNNKPFRRQYQRAFEAFRFANTADMEETIAGARLLSGTFQTLSTTAGILAYAVRVSGDTAAGIVGSSVKVFGTCAKAAGSGLALASSRLESTDNIKNKKGPAGKNPNLKHSRQDTEEATVEPIATYQTSGRRRQHKKGNNFGKTSRKVISKSANVVGNVLGGLGESLLIAGVAAESLASSTAGVAEETVRVLEDLAAAISVAISLRGRSKYRERHKTTASSPGMDPLRKSVAPSYLSFGTYGQGFGPQSEDETPATVAGALRSRLMQGPRIEDAIELMALLLSDVVSFGKDVSAEVEGIPSMALEVGVALFVCFLFSRLLLSQKSRKGSCRAQQADTGALMKKDNDRCAKHFGVTQKRNSGDLSEEDKLASRSRSYTEICRSCIGVVSRLLIILPGKFFCWAFHVAFRLLYNRTTILLSIHCFVWIYLSRLSQQRVLLIQR